MLSIARALPLLFLFAGTGTAQAGRPPATDDASVADTGSCQVETWLERQPADRAWVVAPACGVAERWEVGGDVTRQRDPGGRSSAVGLAAKWLPLPGSIDTPLGSLTLGSKLALAGSQFGGTRWRVESIGALALASLQLRPDVQVHLNLRPARERSTRTNHTVFNTALTWAPTSRSLLFAEALATDDSALAGGTVRTAGGRWWLEPDRLGLDLTASRQAGSVTATRWSLGIGWHGIGQ